MFLHFLDYYHYHVAKEIYSYPDTSICEELALAFRFAFLLTEEAFIPASAYFENQAARAIIEKHLAFSDSGGILLCSGDPSLPEHFERKKELRYDKYSPSIFRKAYEKMPPVSLLYRAAPIRTGIAINKEWSALLNSGNLISTLSPFGKPTLQPTIETVWEKIPTVLGNRAFVTSHVIEGFQRLEVRSPTELQLLRVLDPAFTRSYASPLKCGLIRDLLYLRTPWVIRNSHSGFSYKQVKQTLLHFGLLSPLSRAQPKTLVQLKAHPSWAQLIPGILSGAESIERAGGHPLELGEVRKFLFPKQRVRSSTVKNHLKQLAIVTALPEEWLAVNTSLGAIELPKIANDPNRYASANISRSLDSLGHASPIQVIVTFLPRMGTNSASAVTTNLLRSFPDIDDLILCGIACGCPFPSDLKKHVRLGDVVISDQRGIVQTDHQVISAEGNKNRSILPPPSRSLLNAVRLFQSDVLAGHNPWRKFLKELIKQNSLFRRPQIETDILTDTQGCIIHHPPDRARRYNNLLFHGAIGSSNTLFRNSHERQQIAIQHDLRAIEMEGSGAAEAVWHFGKGYLVVRGICDYGDARKNDKWHYFAAAAAAAATKAILTRV